MQLKFIISLKCEGVLRDDEAVGLWLISSVGNVLVRSVFRFRYRFDTKLFLVLQIVWTK